MPKRVKARLRVTKKMIALAGITTVVAVLAGLQSLSEVAAQSPSIPSPGIFAGQENAKLGNLESDVMARGFEGSSHDRLAALSHQLLLKDPLNSRAVRGVALTSPEAQAQGLLRLSERISRRDPLTQILLAQHSVDQGDIRGALVHYNRALTTSLSARPLLFPILRGAVDDDAIRAETQRYIDAGQPWAEAFFRDALAANAKPDGLTKLLLSGRPSPFRAALIQKLAPSFVPTLAEDQYFGLARAYYLRLPGTAAADLTSIGFSSATTVPDRLPLTWAIQANSLFGAAFEAASGSGQVAHIFASPGETGWVLRKIIYLSPGSYRMTAKRDVSPNARGHAEWKLVCIRKAGRQEILSTPLGTDGLFRIDSDCPAQEVQLIASAEEGGDGYDAIVRQSGIQRLD